MTNEELIQIIDLLLKHTEDALANKDIKLSVSVAAKKYVLEKGTDLKYGARPLRRAIQKYIEDEIAEMLLRSEVSGGQTKELEKTYEDYEIENFSELQISLYKEENGFCDEHYYIGENDGSIGY